MLGYKMSVEEQLADLRTISSTVDEYLNRELFKETTTPDAYTVNDILNECYSILYEEMEDMGIKFMVTLAEVLEDYYTAKNLVYLYQCLLPSALNSNLQNAEILDYTESQLMETDEFTLMNILSTMAEAYPNNFALQQSQDILTFVCGTPRIYNYISGICVHVRVEGGELREPDPIKAAAYIEHTEKVRWYAAKAANTLQNHEIFVGRINPVAVAKLLRDYDMDKLSAEDIAIYSVVDDMQCPDTFSNAKNLAMYAHHCRSPHHLEYWQTHKSEKPTIENLLVFVAHFVEPDTDAELFWKELNESIKLAEKDNVFTEKDIQTILTMGKILYPTVKEN